MGRRQRPKYLEKDHKKVIFITKNLKSMSSQKWMWSITDAYVKQKFKLTEKYLIRDWNYEKKVKNGSRPTYWREISSLHLNQDKNMLRTHSFMLFTINKSLRNQHLHTQHYIGNPRKAVHTHNQNLNSTMANYSKRMNVRSVDINTVHWCA